VFSRSLALCYALLSYLNCVIYRIDTVEVRSSSLLVPTIPSNHIRRSGAFFTPVMHPRLVFCRRAIAENRGQHAALRHHPFSWHALRIEVQGRLNLRVPQ
jgi:hypothetical protein